MKHLRRVLASLFATTILFGLVAALAFGSVSTASAQGPADALRWGRVFDEAAVEATLKATGLSEGDLLRELASGKSLSQILTEKGSDVAAVKADVVKAVTETINTAKTEGKLTQAQADRLLANLSQHVDQIFERVFKRAGRRQGW